LIGLAAEVAGCQRSLPPNSALQTATTTSAARNATAGSRDRMSFFHMTGISEDGWWLSDPIDVTGVEIGSGAL
jgi:hypothetical protein